jgi:hypothetical protein
MHATFSLKSDRLEGEPGMAAGPRVKAEILPSGKPYLEIAALIVGFWKKTAFTEQSLGWNTFS